MCFNHVFKVKATWHSSQVIANSKLKTYAKSHTITIKGKPPIDISAAKAFKGNPNLYNPEDLLLSSIVSCHMMSYFYVCSQNGIDVVSYIDEAEAVLNVTEEGSGRFVEVRLYPKVIIAQSEKMNEAMQLHKKANQLCFIANSCNFPIIHFPTCTVDE